MEAAAAEDKDDDDVDGSASREGEVAGNEHEVEGCSAEEDGS